MKEDNESFAFIDDIEDYDEIEHHENITIPVEEYLYLRDRSLWLEVLDQGGVDNWEGIDYCKDIYAEYERQQVHMIH